VSFSVLKWLCVRTLQAINDMRLADLEIGHVLIANI